MATRWPWCWTVKASRQKPCSSSPTGPTCPKPPLCCRPRPRAAPPGPTTACASSAPGASCPLPATPRWAAAMPGCRPAATPQGGDVVQECGVGLVTLRQDGDRLAFAAPPLIQSGPLAEADVARIAQGLGVARSDILHHAWCDNGPNWRGVMLRSAEQVLALKPDGAILAGLDVGVVGPAAGRGASAPRRRGGQQRCGRHRLRSARLLPRQQRPGRRPGHRQPERRAGAVAHRRGPGARAATWPARAPPWAAPGACMLNKMARISGWAATPSPACGRGAAVSTTAQALRGPPRWCWPPTWPAAWHGASARWAWPRQQGASTRSWARTTAFNICSPGAPRAYLEIIAINSGATSALPRALDAGLTWMMPAASAGGAARAAAHPLGGRRARCGRPRCRRRTGARRHPHRQPPHAAWPAAVAHHRAPGRPAPDGRLPAHPHPVGRGAPLRQPARQRRALQAAGAASPDSRPGARHARPSAWARQPVANTRARPFSPPGHAARAPSPSHPLPCPPP